eukprot:6141512-Heterocapsa_arctica.AAC.1
MEDYEVLTTNIQTNTTERLRNTQYARGTTMEQHDLMGHSETMMEEDKPMIRYGVMRGEPILIRPAMISSGSEEEPTRVVRQRIV